MYIGWKERFYIFWRRTCEAIEEEADAVVIVGANDVGVAEEGRVGGVEGEGGEVVETCVGYGEGRKNNKR